MWKKYNVISTQEDLQKVDEFLIDSEGKLKHKFIALDTETNGIAFKKSVLIGISFSTDDKMGFYIPFLRWVPNTESAKSTKKLGNFFTDGHFLGVWDNKIYPEFVNPENFQIPENIKNFIVRWFSQAKLILHNAPFDINMIWANTGIDLANQVYLDTSLLAHCVNENLKLGLKEVAIAWKTELGFDPFKAANLEQQEMGSTVIKNGGTFNTRTKHVWRADYKELGKYAIMDVLLTYGVFQVGIKKFIADYGHDKLEWFFKDEVMPLCREVVIPMKRQGVFINVPYFEKLLPSTQKVLDALEDRIMKDITPYLDDFPLAKGVDELVTPKKIIEALIEAEGVEYPFTVNKKGETKPSLAKKAVKEAYERNPHWIYGYILGEDEIRWSEEKLTKLKTDLYQKALKRRYRFNIASRDHLIWLFCKKLRNDPAKLPQTKASKPDKPRPAMTAEVLNTFFKEKYYFVKYLVLWHKLEKLKGSYIKPALALNVDGWLFMDIKQNGTISGRFSCSGGFNLQTLPKVAEMPTECEKCKEPIKLQTVMPLLHVYKCTKCGFKRDDLLDSSAIKAGFISAPSKKIIAADYQALEPRCFAFMSGDSKLKDIYKNKLDIYSKVYCDVHGEPYRDLKKSGENDKRNDIKQLPLGVAYGARGPQVARMLGFTTIKKWKNKHTGKFENKEVLDVEKGWEIRDQFLDTYPDLRNFMEQSTNNALSQGWVQTIIGRKRHFIYTQYIYNLLSSYSITVDEFLDMKNKDLESPNASFGLTEEDLIEFCNVFKIKYEDMLKKKAWIGVRNLFKNELNNSINCRIQGLAAHLTNRAMLEANRAFKEAGLDALVILQVHDEIICYASEKDVSKAEKLLQESMINNKYTKLLDVKMEASPVVCDNLKDSK